MSVPATLQATIAARIDRLEPSAKRTLGAAAVVGMRFSHEDLESLEIEPAFDGLVFNELIDQVQFTQRNEFAFRHPLIRAVAYESQLTAERARLHRRLAAAIQARDPESADEKAALIAEHLEAAGDLNEAFEWHMKACDWLTYRDIASARASWHRARNVADRLPRDHPDRSAMRIAPRTMLSASAFRGLSVGDTGYEELRDLCVETGDHTSLAIGMAGLPVSLMLQNQHREAAKLAAEHVQLLESIGDPVLTVGLLHAAMTAKMHSGEVAEALRLAQVVVDLADGDVNKGLLLIGSPLAQATMVRGIIRCCLGDSGCKEDFEQTIDLAQGADALTKIITAAYPYVVHIPTGALHPDATAMSRTADALRLAEQYGDDFALGLARMARITALRLRDDTDHEAEVDLLRVARESPMWSGNKQGVMMVDCEIAAQELRTGHTDDAIELSRTVVDDSFDGGEVLTRAPAVTVLVESLLRRGTDADVQEAEAAIERLATVTVEPGFVLFELPLLRMRALLARARGDETGYREFRDRYRERATSLGFEGHVKVAAAMP